MAGRKRIVTKGVTQSFFLEGEQLDWLKENAGNLNQSASAFLRDMIEEFRSRRHRKEQLDYSMSPDQEKKFRKLMKPSLWQRLFGR